MECSNNWKSWKAFTDLKTCLTCKKNNGKIYHINEPVYPQPPIHTNCRCVIEQLLAIIAGEATNNGIDGADWYLKHKGYLPDYYISKDLAEKLGYKSYLGNLNTVAPNKMMYKGIYKNTSGHLPSAPNRIWYEADINYTGGYRNDSRILFSNDGLIFVTYDHYHTFYEIK